VLSVLAPKAVEQYMDVIEREATLLVDRLIETTEKEGSVHPVTLLELNSLNVICHVTVGKRFMSIEDPEFKKVVHMVETGMTLAGADRDMPNFLPAFSIFDYLAGTQVEMRNFINNVRNPTLGKLIKEAEVNEGPNIFKTFNEEDFSLDEENKLVILSKFLNYTINDKMPTIL
jgi:hypothetical protein